jgi:hypothetical protein
VETRRESLDIFEPGELPPWIDPDANIGFFTASPYVARDARVGINAIGSRTSFYLSGFDIQRNYVEDGFGDEQGTGAAFRASRDLASNMSIDFTAMYSDHERDASTIGQDNLSATHDYDTQFVIRGNRDVGSSIKASLEAGFLNRSGDINYDGWWVGLRGRWTPAMR